MQAKYNDDVLKRCTQCREQSPQTPKNWARNPRRSDGLADVCRLCQQHTDRKPGKTQTQVIQLERQEPAQKDRL